MAMKRGRDTFQARKSVVFSTFRNLIPLQTSISSIYTRSLYYLIPIVIYQNGNHCWRSSSVFTVKSPLSHGGLIICCCFEGDLIQRGLISNLRYKFYASGLLHSLCIASIGKSALSTSKVYLY